LLLERLFKAAHMFDATRYPEMHFASTCARK
jgi:polyisoprenoid-binding protein YceI